jgi:hypothetical protein
VSRPGGPDLDAAVRASMSLGGIFDNPQAVSFCEFDVGGKFLFKVLDEPSADELRRFQDIRNCTINFGRKLAILCFQIEERDFEC